MIGGSSRVRWGASALVALVLVAVVTSSASAEKPSIISAPTVTGIAMEGETLQGHGGVWTGEPPFSFTFDWQRCNNGGGDCVMIGVPKSEFYTVTAADIGFRIRAWVAATGQDCGEWNYSNGTRECRAVTIETGSEQTPVVVPNPKFLPRSATSPTVSGLAEEGEALQADDGGWTGLEPITVLRRWERCQAGGDGCEAIPGAVEKTYRLTSRDVGRTIRIAVTGKNARGVSPAVPSAPTAVVVALRPRSGRTTIDVGKVAAPHRLLIDRFSFEPAPVRGRIRVTARFRVSDTRGFRVRGAIVHVAAVRAGLIGAVPDVTTGPDGWATVRLRPTERVVFRAGGAIELLVRAVGTRESGVSAQRRVTLRLGAPGR
jgi:hypothetical protein